MHFDPLLLVMNLHTASSGAGYLADSICLVESFLLSSKKKKVSFRQLFQKSREHFQIESFNKRGSKEIRFP